MKNNFISPYNLPPLSDFLARREMEIKALISALPVENFSDEKLYSEILTGIKQMMMIEPVEFGEPCFVDYELELPANYLRSDNADKLVIHKIEVPYRGDRAMFMYKPDLESVSIFANEVVIIPFAEKLKIYVDAPNVDIDAALKRAKELMALTLRIVLANNLVVHQWNSLAVTKIEQLLAAHQANLCVKSPKKWNKQSQSFSENDSTI